MLKGWTIEYNGILVHDLAEQETTLHTALQTMVNLATKFLVSYANPIKRKRTLRFSTRRPCWQRQISLVPG